MRSVSQGVQGEISQEEVQVLGTGEVIFYEAAPPTYIKELYKNKNEIVY